ncbi:hypothetical protein EV421DRAFT_1725316 [Armillaria borealis]|uniref:Uncharacterized protein n=1 Tax=Armillaria borealis TaxID=47425 RepID=A0AA39IC20_9AGAR|nr:hypothetical protein EV421DRAFT_1725316 [Armillaria borealis]
MADEYIHLATEHGPIHYQLVGVVYFGHSHFTSRYIDPSGTVWFNDGMVQGRRAAHEGHISNLNMLKDPTGKIPDAFIYRWLAA